MDEKDKEKLLEFYEGLTYDQLLNLYFDSLKKELRELQDLLDNKKIDLDRLRNLIINLRYASLQEGRKEITSILRDDQCLLSHNQKNPDRDLIKIANFKNVIYSNERGDIKRLPSMIWRIKEEVVDLNSDVMKKLQNYFELMHKRREKKYDDFKQERSRCLSRDKTRNSKRSST